MNGTLLEHRRLHHAKQADAGCLLVYDEKAVLNLPQDLEDDADSLVSDIKVGRVKKSQVSFKDAFHVQFRPSPLAAGQVPTSASLKFNFRLSSVFKARPLLELALRPSIHLCVPLGHRANLRDCLEPERVGPTAVVAGLDAEGSYVWRLDNSEAEVPWSLAGVFPYTQFRYRIDTRLIVWMDKLGWCECKVGGEVGDRYHLIYQREDHSESVVCKFYLILLSRPFLLLVLPSRAVKFTNLEQVKCDLNDFNHTWLAPLSDHYGRALVLVVS